MPPDVVIAFADVIWEQIVASLNDDNETAGVLMAGVAEDDDRLTYTVNRVLWVPEEHYAERTPRRLSIASAGWVPALKAAAHAGLHPIFFHTHPGAPPMPSTLDDHVDAALASPFRDRARVERYTSFILGGTVAQPSFSGRVFHRDGSCVSITRARVAGRRLRVLPASSEKAATAAAKQVHDRQIRAFGTSGQQALAQLCVGVVGAGGTGSAVLEQLIRLGVRNIVTIDDDVITSTNVSRVYGSTAADEGQAKVQVAKSNAQRIGLGTRVVAHEGRIDKRAGLELLRTCDVVFGCTDDHTGRLNLSLLAYYYLIVVIDLGVAIDAPQERVRSITGRVTYVAPGEPCLLCRGVVDPARVRDEGYEPQERERLAGEGYAQGLGEPDPAVVAYTTMVAAWGVADLLERMFGFGADDTAGELHLRIADRKMKGRHAQPKSGHICAEPGRWGLGDQPAFLGQSVADVNDRMIDWWRRRRWTTPRYPSLTYVPSRSDLPDLPPRRTIVVVGNPERPKWAVFACPCGHAHAIVINLSPARRPSWRLKVNDGRPSLRPSVDSVLDGLRCHFWLRDGRVHWAQDADSQDILGPATAGHQRGDSRHGA